MPPLSVLDLAPIVQGGDASQALHNSLDLARHAERLGYRRFWLAEHHNMPGIASSAPAVLIGAVAAVTGTIRCSSRSPTGTPIPTPTASSRRRRVAASSPSTATPTCS